MLRGAIRLSLLLALGVSPRVVMEIVGHSAIEMTMNVYGHASLDNQRAALDLLKAWGTGHPGGIGTIHAGSAIGALRR